MSTHTGETMLAVARGHRAAHDPCRRENPGGYVEQEQEADDGR